MTQVNIEVHRAQLDRRYRQKKTRVYFSHNDETIYDNLMNRRARPVDVYKTYLRAVSDNLGITARMAKFRWSQKAGCGCGCSPGFICDEDYGKDVWVTLSPDVPRIEDSVAQLIEAGMISAPADRRVTVNTMPNLNEQ